ncbi:hypothetical protein RchiOBHm_Chr6g0265961 [Rosa chinensis]|uniref:Reverse transcriptase domain-containing protein n=1 Tax=Rosa chinensis TaxID=74649 RepID=A0A2P6PPL0_ROSCH|nr:hypothetical protein RchiOBHm_Chr6g0265961 [Rosa chinensis]
MIRDEIKGEVIPKEIEGVLESYVDVMPPELPKELPPRRSVDHEIKLLPGGQTACKGALQNGSPRTGGTSKAA